ncbi:MAG: SpoIIIAH-like family protein, partial [Clostridia bacterium]|nr:SpoIIIAH-like family protein [Clostridia bacterium]
KTEDSLVTLITAKTGGECVVMITDGATQIVVQKGILNDDTALQIMDIITRNTELDPTKVTMSEPK